MSILFGIIKSMKVIKLVKERLVTSLKEENKFNLIKKFKELVETEVVETLALDPSMILEEVDLPILLDWFQENCSNPNYLCVIISSSAEKTLNNFNITLNCNDEGLVQIIVDKESFSIEASRLVCYGKLDVTLEKHLNDGKGKITITL